MKEKIPPSDLFAQLSAGHELENGARSVLIILCGLLVFATYDVIRSVTGLPARVFILVMASVALVVAGVRILS